MSTPTPGAQSGHAVKNPTPSHTAATPRSVPSPALSRQHASSLSAKQPSKHPGGVPMAPSLSQASNTSGGAKGAAAGLGINNAGIKVEGVSPAHLGMSGHGMSFASPAAGMMGLDGLGMGTPGMGDPGSVTGMGGVGMGITLSEMGIQMGQDRGKRDEDEERRKKVAGVLERIGGRERKQTGKSKRSGMGRVGDEGVRRVGRWAGFDVEVESKYEGKEWEGNRPIVIAGRNAVLIDVAFRNSLASKVEVTFNTENEAVTAHQAGAASVLKDNLTPRDGIASINTRLDRFAENLERLGRLDKLSTPNLNCVDAVTGLYVAFKKLFEHEKEAAKTLFNGADASREEKVNTEVMTKKSGQPGMHINDRIGPSLNFWSETSSSKLGQDDALVYSLELTVEHSDPSTFPSIRISNNWLADRVVKPTEESSDPTDLISNKPALDWLEPDPTMIQPSKDNSEAMAVDEGLKPPEVRFVARLHPPIVMPYTTAAQILQSSGLTSMPTIETPQQYETALLNLPPSTRHNPNDATTVSERTIFLPNPDQEKDTTHRNSLYVPKPEFGFKLTEIPFSHPRQIVAVLPTLRQWARLGALLSTSFSVPAATGTSQTQATAPSKTVPLRTQNGKKLALDALLNGHETPALNGDAEAETDARAALPVDITLSTSLPAPSVTVFFPVGGRLGSVTFEVGTDGEVGVVAQDIVVGEVGGGADAGEGMDVDGEKGMDVVQEQARMARALEVVGDVGVWVEWMRRRYQ
ncbi:RNA polymerase II transcription cofactor-like protein 2 [Elsinoe australis]|uniref:Mediator of RNA polymerase II transcription subunit 1 n=1 Tax=Elsinoe australis TaxID=40998 RepID=A0A4V6DTJ9_9PEZI|nr:RNA polymerase II transcription cofactor-like protein 2 [Elsinoe australis]